MEKKRLKKKSKEWACKEGCPVTKVPCKHLEKLLRPVNDGSLKRETLEEIKRNEQLNEQVREDYDARCDRLEANLLARGVERFRVDLIMDRFMSNLTLKEIADNRGYVDAEAVRFLINSTLKVLGSGGMYAAKALMGDFE